MNRHELQSSHIKAIEHDGEGLTVEFLDGARYRHQGVPAVEFERMKAADSAGQFYHRHIKGRYPHTRL